MKSSIFGHELDSSFCSVARGVHIVAVLGEKKGRLRVYRNVPYEFALTISRLGIIETFFASTVGIILYATLRCAKQRVHKR